MKTIYIYSNSTRKTGRKFDESFIPDNSPDAIHVFMNDVYAYRSNYEKFKDLKNIIVITSYDGVELIKNTKLFFDSKINPIKFILCTSDYYYIVNPKTYEHDGKRHGFLNPLSNTKKSLTCGARAIIICNELYLNDNQIILVNFSDQRDPLYNKNPSHDFEFERMRYTMFKHIYI